MERSEFLRLMGGGAAIAILGSCLGVCKKDGGDVAPSNVDFTIDLTASANAALKSNGGYIYNNGLIVAKTLSGDYIAVSKTCTHEGSNAVVYDASNQLFYCRTHEATFSETGAVTGSPARRALKQYNITLTGTSLRLYS